MIKLVQNISMLVFVHFWSLCRYLWNSLSLESIIHEPNSPDIQEFTVYVSFVGWPELQWAVGITTFDWVSFELENIELFNWQDEDLKLADGLLQFTSYCQWFFNLTNIYLVLLFFSLNHSFNEFKVRYYIKA